MRLLSPWRTCCIQEGSGQQIMSNPPPVPLAKQSLHHTKRLCKDCHPTLQQQLHHRTHMVAAWITHLGVHAFQTARNGKHDKEGHNRLFTIMLTIRAPKLSKLGYVCLQVQKFSGRSNECSGGSVQANLCLFIPLTKR